MIFLRQHQHPRGLRGRDAKAAGLAVYGFRQDGFTEFVSNGFGVEIRERMVKHHVSVGRSKIWLNGTVSDPRQRTRRDKLKEMVG